MNLCYIKKYKSWLNILDMDKTTAFPLFIQTGLSFLGFLALIILFA